MTIRPIFAWYDFWVGAYLDRAKRRLYVFPVPMLGAVIGFGPRRQPVEVEEEDWCLEEGDYF